MIKMKITAHFKKINTQTHASENQSRYLKGNRISLGPKLSKDSKIKVK